MRKYTSLRVHHNLKVKQILENNKTIFHFLSSFLIVTLAFWGCNTFHPTAETEKTVYKENEPIIVNYYGFPKMTHKSQKWIVTIVPSSAPVYEFGQHFELKDDIYNGMLPFDGLAAGKYRVACFLITQGSSPQIVGSPKEFMVVTSKN